MTEYMYSTIAGDTMSESEATPEGVVTASKGSLHTDTLAHVIYVKTTDTGNTGWVSTAGGGGAATFVGAKAAQLSTTQLSSSSANAVATLGTACFDTASMYSGGTSITAPVDGYYLCQGQICLTAIAADGNVGGWITHSADGVIARSYFRIPGGSIPMTNLSVVYWFNAGESITLTSNRSSADSFIYILAGETGYGTWLSMVKLG